MQNKWLRLIVVTTLFITGIVGSGESMDRLSSRAQGVKIGKLVTKAETYRTRNFKSTRTRNSFKKGVIEGLLALIEQVEGEQGSLAEIEQARVACTTALTNDDLSADELMRLARQVAVLTSTEDASSASSEQSECEELDLAPSRPFVHLESENTSTDVVLILTAKLAIADEVAKLEPLLSIRSSDNLSPAQEVLLQEVTTAVLEQLDLIIALDKTIEAEARMALKKQAERIDDRLQAEGSFLFRGSRGTIFSGDTAVFVLTTLFKIGKDLYLQLPAAADGLEFPAAAAVGAQKRRCSGSVCAAATVALLGAVVTAGWASGYLPMPSADELRVMGTSIAAYFNLTAGAML